MVDQLTFSSMTWDLLEDKHGIVAAVNQVLFDGCPPVEPSPILSGNLKRMRRLRMANERAKAYRLIDPVLAEVDTLRFGQISTIPELYMDVPGKEGLCGLPDFIISASPTFKALPIIAIVEAKRSNWQLRPPSSVRSEARERALVGRMKSEHDVLLGDP